MEPYEIFSTFWPLIILLGILLFNLLLFFIFVKIAAKIFTNTFLKEYKKFLCQQTEEEHLYLSNKLIKR